MARSYKARKVMKDAEYKERYEKTVDKKKQERSLRESKKKGHRYEEV